MNCRWTIEVLIDGYTPKSHRDALASFNHVSDRHLETLGTPMLAGRDFSERDTTANPR